MARLTEDENALHVELSDEDVAAIRYGGACPWLPPDYMMEGGRWEALRCRLHYDQRIHAFAVGVLLGAAIVFCVCMARAEHPATSGADSAHTIGVGEQWERRQ